MKVKLGLLALCLSFCLALLPSSVQAQPETAAYGCTRVRGHSAIITEFSPGFLLVPNVLQLKLLAENRYGYFWTYKKFYKGQKVRVDYDRCYNDNGIMTVYVKAVR